MISVAEKACNHCGLIQPTDAFHADRKGRDGKSSRCKSCVRAYQQANKDSIRARRIQYVEENREKVLEGKRRHYHANRDDALESHRRWRSDNADAVRKYAARVYRDGGRPTDRPWPDGPVAYTTAHCRVKATYGAAKNHACARCGAQAHAWAYDHSDPNPLFHQGTGAWTGRPPIPYSPDPNRYDPLCRSCHVKRDRYGAA